MRAARAARREDGKMLSKWIAETKEGQFYKKPEKRICRPWVLEYSQRVINSLESSASESKLRATYRFLTRAKCLKLQAS